LTRSRLFGKHNVIKRLTSSLFAFAACTFLVSAPAWAAPTINVYPLPAGVVTSFITAGPDGALWFTAGDANRIGRITTAGVVTTYPIPTALGEPFAIATGSDGALWFTERSGNKIGRITTQGAITEYPIPSESALAQGIALGSDGAMWFVEPHRNGIGRINVNGAITEITIPSPSTTPQFIAKGPDGAMWFTESYGKVGRIDAGVVTELPQTEGAPPGAYNQGITAGPDGAVWIATSGTGTAVSKISRITIDTWRSFDLPATLSGPSQIVAGADGALWFTVFRNKIIGRITVTGSITEYSVPSVDYLVGITKGPDGALWFAAGNKIGRFAP
jgi:virginiamycin B lyase